MNVFGEITETALTPAASPPINLRRVTFDKIMKSLPYEKMGAPARTIVRSDSRGLVAHGLRDIQLMASNRPNEAWPRPSSADEAAPSVPDIPKQSWQ
jgi:hypothetical protein